MIDESRRDLYAIYQRREKEIYLFPTIKKVEIVLKEKVIVY